MRTLSTRAAIATALLIVCASAVLAAEVAWTDDSFETILHKARAENRLVLIDFYTTWCGPCKKLDKETYTNDAVIKFMNPMISVKYDSEKDAGIDLSKKYRVAAWPTIMLLDTSGKEIDRIVGFVEPEEFMKVIGGYQKGIGTVADYEARVKKDPEDAEALKILGQKYADAIRGREANEAFTKYLELTPNIAGEEKAEALYSIGEAYYVDKAYNEAVKIFTGIIKDFPDSEWRDDATTRLARCYYGLGNTEKCVTTYKAYVDRNADDKRACNAFAWFCATKKVGLDEALPVALRAVELSERDPGYLDTLAELYYARGEFDLAIEIGQEAAGKDPEDQYLKDQLDKFKKAKEAADGQASR